jgi:hypothetical protein
MLAWYQPSWVGAVPHIIGQSVVIGILFAAVCAYTVQRHRKAVVVCVLSTGIISASLGWLAYVWSSDGFSEESVIAFFELNRFQVAAFFGIVASWLLLEAASLGWRLFFGGAMVR